jgi:hypothetical protein
MEIIMYVLHRSLSGLEETVPAWTLAGSKHLTCGDNVITYVHVCALRVHSAGTRHFASEGIVALYTQCKVLSSNPSAAKKLINKIKAKKCKRAKKLWEFTLEYTEPVGMGDPSIWRGSGPKGGESGRRGWAEHKEGGRKPWALAK